jgi:hypothetical protein
MLEGSNTPLSENPTMAELARELLLYKMQEYSEALCASWLSNAEFDIWELGEPGASDPGGPDWQRQNALACRKLGALAGGWWVYDRARHQDGEAGWTGENPHFIALTEWTERHAAWRGQSDRLVMRVRAHVRQLLLTNGIDIHIARLGALADDLTLVRLLALVDEKLAALLNTVEGITGRHAGAVRDEASVRAVRDFANPRLIASGKLMDKGGAARLGKDAPAHTNQTAGWNQEINTSSTVGTVLNVLHARSAFRHDPRDNADKVDRYVDRELLKRLLNAVLRSVNQHLRTGYLELKSFTAHLLHKDCKLKFTAATHLERFT